jgi:hypothetical protein
MGTVLSSGVWTNLTFDVQTTFPKQYLTSSYSAAGVYKICWQWTQNTTVPIDVLLDHQQIPEFGDLVLPLLGMIAIFAVYTWPSRTATCARDTPRRTSVTTARRAKTNRKLPPRMRGG